jgi:hypothetical protein
VLRDLAYAGFKYNFILAILAYAAIGQWVEAIFPLLALMLLDVTIKAEAGKESGLILLRGV